MEEYLSAVYLGIYLAVCGPCGPVFDAARVVSEPPGVMAPGPPKVVWCVLCIGHQGDFRKSRKDVAALEPRLSLTPISRIRPREFQAPCPSFSPTGQVNRGQTVRARPINQCLGAAPELGRRFKRAFRGARFQAHLFLGWNWSSVRSRGGGCQAVARAACTRYFCCGPGPLRPIYGAFSINRTSRISTWHIPAQYPKATFKLYMELSF